MVSVLKSLLMTHVQLWSSPVVAVLFLAWALSEVSDAAHLSILRLPTWVLSPASAHKRSCRHLDPVAMHSAA